MCSICGSLNICLQGLFVLSRCEIPKYSIKGYNTQNISLKPILTHGVFITQFPVRLDFLLKLHSTWYLLC